MIIETGTGTNYPSVIESKQKIPTSFSSMTIPGGRQSKLAYDKKNERFIAMQAMRGNNYIYSMPKDGTAWTAHTYTATSLFYGDIYNIEVDIYGNIIAVHSDSYAKGRYCMSSLTILADGTVSVITSNFTSAYLRCNPKLVNGRYICTQQSGSYPIFNYITYPITSGKSFTQVTVSLSTNYSSSAGNAFNYDTIINYINGEYRFANIIQYGNYGSDSKDLYFNCYKSSNLSSWSQLLSSHLYLYPNRSSAAAMFYFDGNKALFVMPPNATTPGPNGKLTSSGIWKAIIGSSNITLTKTGSTFLSNNDNIGMPKSVYNGEYTYMYTQYNGFWYSTNDGETWTKVSGSFTSNQNWTSFAAVYNSET